MCKVYGEFPNTIPHFLVWASGNDRVRVTVPVHAGYKLEKPDPV